ncbi:MAG: trypsin-like peptidase domain-containing protein [Planctomycetota bacterium]
MPIRWYGPSLILLATVLLVMLLGPDLARKIVWNHTDARITQVRQGLIDQPGLASLSQSFSDVSAAVEPSVVHIQTLGPSARSGGGFFRRFDPLEPLSNGSGWVYRHAPADGSPARTYILTNHHVVADAPRIRVRFSDASEHTATLVGSDLLTDVAVLRVAEPLLHAADVDFDPVRKGQIVFAFGSPFRFDFSVSQGIVSASGRQLDVTNSGKYENFIQTDAAINPGNSGGPLTNIYGQVVGMNTAIASSRSRNPGDPGGFMGLGFAIPVRMAVDVATRIIENGEVRRGYLGVTIRDLTPALAASFDVEPVGVLLEHAVGRGPADRAGLQPGDVITHVADQAVNAVDELRYRIAAFDPGTTVELAVLRRGQRLAVSVTLDELTPPVAAPRDRFLSGLAFSPTVTAQEPTLRALGIERLAEFTHADAEAARLPPIEGVFVVDVRFGSLADRQRIQDRAIITHLGDQPVPRLAALRRALGEHPRGAPLRLTVRHWDPVLQEFVTRFALLEAPPR